MENTVITWRFEGLFKADATKVYEEIGGNLDITPEEVLEKARNENTELHKCFEWDNDTAAEKYRVLQARQVIKMLVYTPVQKSKENDIPISVFSLTDEKNVYKPIKMILKNPDEYQKLLNRAYNDLLSMEKRYSTIKELKPIFDEIPNIAKIVNPQE